MRRLARRLFTLCSAVSLVLCVAVCVLWVRSYWAFDWPSLSSEGRPGDAATDWGVWGLSCRGVLSARAHRDRYWGAALVASQRRTGRRHAEWRVLRQVPPDRPVLALRTHGNRYPGSDNVNAGVAAPHAVYGLLLSVLPALWVRGRQTTRQRRRAGLCPACGYDLRASTGRCPECGAAAGPHG